MGNSWTKNSAVQQPPPVCKKPPEKLPAATPAIQDLELQAFVDARLVLTPGGFRTTALIFLKPNLLLNGWIGNTVFPIQNIELEIIANPTYELFSVEITALVGPAPVRSFMWHDLELQSRDPFIMPMLTQTVPPNIEFWQARILA